MNDTTTKSPHLRPRARASVGADMQRSFLRRYDPLGPCGSGGMGTVYRARDRMTDRVVAVKLIPRPDEWQRVQREIEALRSIDHPSVVRMLDFGFEEDQVVLVMDFVQGPTLEALLNTTPRVPWDTALRLTLTVLEGLVRIHEVGLVHRDIKPSNLIVADPHGTAVVIIDFGIVKPMDETRRITAVGTVVGTPAYMPPEQLLGMQIGPSADIYAIGLVLLQMLTGQRPRTLGLDALATKMRFSPRVSMPELHTIPEAVPTLLRHMLHPLPQRRLSNAAECARLLQDALDVEDVPQARVQQRSTLKVTAAYPPH